MPPPTTTTLETGEDDVMRLAFVRIVDLVTRHVKKDTVNWIIVNHFLYNLEGFFLNIRRIDGNDIHIGIDDPLTFW